MKETQEKRLYEAFSRDAVLPESFSRMLAETCDTIRREEGRGKDSDMNKHMKKGLKTALLIAAAVAVLTASVFAVYQMTMTDRVIRTGYGHYEYSAAGGAVDDHYYTSTEYGETYIPSAEGDPEYLAMQEWEEYLFDEKHYEAFDWPTDLDDPMKAIYDIGWRGLADKCAEIAEKYGLRLYEASVYTDTAEEFWSTLGTEPFAPLASCETGKGLEGYDWTGIIMDDGSFRLAGVQLPLADRAVDVTVYRAVKGSFCDFYLYGDAPEDYVCETYTTADGTTVELALGKTVSFIFAELENSYVTIHGIDGRDSDEAADMDTLHAAADAIDFRTADVVAEEYPAVTASFERSMEEIRAHVPSRTENWTKVFEDLGTFEITGLDDGYYRRPGIKSFEDSADTLWAYVTGGAGFEAITWSYIDADPKDVIGVEDSAYFLRYTRYWADEARTELLNRESFLIDRGNADVLVTNASGEPVDLCLIDCTVNGYEGYSCVDPMFGYPSVSWLDTDNNLVFELSVNHPATQEEAIALAESVARVES